MKRYSIILRPSDDVIKIVTRLKNNFPIVGWYASKNSEAHLTILGFNCSDEMLPIILRYMDRFAASVENHEYHFDSFGHFSGTFFVKLDKTSEDLMMKVFRSFNANFPKVKISDKEVVSKPHMTIARQVTAVQIQDGYNCFSNEIIDFTTHCTLAIRRLDEIKQQFQIIKEFSFFGDEHIYPTSQLKLF